MSQSNGGRATGAAEPTRESRLPPPRPSPRTAASHSLLSSSSSGSSDDVHLKGRTVAPSIVGHDSATVQGSMSMPPPPRRLTSASNRPLSMASIDEDMAALAAGAARDESGNDVAVTDEPNAPVAASNLKVARSEDEGSSRISLSSLLSLRSAQGTSVTAEGSAAPSSVQSNATEYSSGIRRAASPTLSTKGDSSSGPTTGANSGSVTMNTQSPPPGSSRDAASLDASIVADIIRRDRCKPTTTGPEWDRRATAWGTERLGVSPATADLSARSALPEPHPAPTHWQPRWEQCKPAYL